MKTIVQGASRHEATDRYDSERDVVESPDARPARSRRQLLSLWAWIPCLLFVLLAFWPSLVEMARIWDVDPNYSHGFLVPVICLIFAGRAWVRHGPPGSSHVPRREAVFGVAEIAIGMLLHGVAWMIGNWPLDVAALILVLQGLLLVIGGREVKQAYSVSVLFLIFMAPLPISWYQPVAVTLQQIVSNTSQFVLASCGVPVFREGFIIHLPGYTMEVGEACSGLRQLTAMLALAVGIGCWGDHSRAYRWILALSAILIAILANTVRIVVTGFILQWFGPEWASGVFHTLEGLAVLGIAAVLLLGLVHLLNKVEQHKGWRTAPQASPSQPGTKAAVKAAGATGLTNRCVLAMVMVLIGCCGYLVFRRHVILPGPLPVVALQQVLADLPLEFNEWRGRDREVTDPKLLYADEHLQRDYVHRKTGQVVSLWLVYSQRGEDRSHHPEVCMAVAGQIEDRAARKTLDVAGHDAPVQQYRFGHSGIHQWIYYWYYTLLPDRSSQLSYLQRLYQRLHFRPSSLTVEVFAPERSEHEVVAAREFVRQLDQALQPLVGSSAVRGSQRKPVTRVEAAE